MKKKLPLIALAAFAVFFLSGCGSMGPFSTPGASYSFEKQGDNIAVHISDTQEVDDLDATAEPIILADGTVICCKISIKKGASKSKQVQNNVLDTLKLIKEVAPLLKVVP